ncbi:MAG TPA: hypothetical protein VGL57_04765 [Solirubrobacteraceae bacterium]|jgi:hypothetical protein
MPHLSTQGRRFAAAFALPILLLACLGLAACGSSSSSPSTTAANAAAASPATQPTTGTTAAGTAAPAGGTSTTAPAGTGTPPAGGPNGTRFAAVRECLSKSGVTLPERPAGGGLLGGGPRGGSPTLPKGMTPTQYSELLKKCGANFRGAGARGPGAFKNRRPLNGAGFRQALAKFGTCLRQNGVKLPAPNTSGKGPIFNTKGVDTKSPQFKQAEVKCRAVLLAGLRASKAGAAGSGTATPGAAGGGAG